MSAACTGYNIVYRMPSKHEHNACRTHMHDAGAQTCTIVHQRGFSSSACSLCSGITPARRPTTALSICNHCFKPDTSQHKPLMVVT